MGRRSESMDDGYGLLIKLLIFVAIIWIGFEGYKSWQSGHEQAIPKHVEQMSPAMPSRQPEQIPPRAELPPSTASSGQVYRCGNAYSSVPCAGAKTIDVRPASGFGTSPTKEIYLCKDMSGQLYWESVACSLSGRTMERIARVPSNVSWSDQVAIARQQRARAQEIAAEQVVPVAPMASTSGSKSASCKALDELVRRLDAECRASSCGMRKLDDVRNARRDARDQQFRLGC